jgi:hypothetical protein
VLWLAQMDDQPGYRNLFQHVFAALAMTEATRAEARRRRPDRGFFMLRYFFCKSSIFVVGAGGLEPTLYGFYVLANTFVAVPSCSEIRLFMPNSQVRG